MRTSARLLAAMLFLCIILFAACTDSIELPEFTKFTFDDDTDGWVGDFADLPIDHVDHGYDVEFSHVEIPVPGSESMGLLLAGDNHSDDLFMYIARGFDADYGLKPDTVYTVELSFDMATGAAAGMMGIGGAPGESVYIKAGVVATEPLSEPGTGGRDGYYVLNLDKANQSQSGEDMIVLGDATKAQGEGQEDDSFRYKPFSHSFEAVTGEDAQLWVVIGSDSGFEGFNQLYYDNIVVTFAVAGEAE
jgi:hypothetical protein